MFDFLKRVSKKLRLQPFEILYSMFAFIIADYNSAVTNAFSLQMVRLKYSTL